MTLRLDEPFRWGGGAMKAVTGPGVTAFYNDVPLSSWAQTPQKRAAQYLKAYKVGWFNKAERKISSDIALLKVSVSPEDAAGDNQRQVIEPDLSTPFERLDPIGQFLRLMERPNPSYTGRQLRQKTEIRIDMAGWSYWYLEAGDQGLPSAIYGISPARMWPSYDKQSQQLIGWVMDADKPSGGVPFTLDEILPFTTATSDDEETYGMGVVEAVHAEIPLTELMARHTADVLSTGGRLAGMIWPKDRALTPDEYLDAQRAWRNVASDPNAAKRMLIFPEPMEWATGASTPAEIGIPELANLTRDNILTAFPMSPYQLGVPMPGGLNSAETRREDRRDYWEGTIHPRVELLEDTIQVGLLSRYEAIVGGSWDFDITEPNLDDAGTLIEKSGALKALISLGFDPKEAVSATGLEHIKYLGPPPEPTVPAEGGLQVGVGDTSRRDSTQTEQPITKSTKAAAEEMRDRTLAKTLPRGTTALSEFLTSQQDRVIGAVRQSLPRTKSERVNVVKADAVARKADWWDAEVEDRELRRILRGLYVEVGREGLQAVADSLDRFVYPKMVDPIVTDLLEYGGERITDINTKTRAAVQEALAEGTRRGYSLNQLIDGVPAESFSGVKGATLDNGLAAFDEARAEMIARTETMLSYNRAAIQGYGQFGVEKMLAYDGDMDAECAARNGSVLPIDEALSITDHPNGTLVWSPVVDKAIHDDLHSSWINIATKAVDALGQKPVINNYIEPAKAPDVHVSAPNVTVEPTQVTVEPAQITVEPSTMQIDVHVPDQPTPDVRFDEGAFHVAAPNVSVEAPSVTVLPSEVTVVPGVAPDVTVDVHVPESKPLNRVIHRDKLGQITGITDGPES